MLLVLIVIVIIMSCLLSKKNHITEHNTNTLHISSQQIHIVVSRYNENIDWLKTNPFNKYRQIIYEKGNKTIPNSIVLKNVGREGHTYLYHIVQNYDNLPDIIIFLPGSAMDSTYNKKQKTLDVMKRMTTKAVMQRCKPQDFYTEYFGKETDYLSILKKFSIDKYVSTNKKNKSINPETILQPASIRPFGAWVHSKLPTLKIIQNVWYNGIFSVTREQILRHPKEMYVSLLNELSGHPNPEVGHFLERFWAGLLCN